MYGAPLKIASRKRKSKKASSEAAEGETSQPKPKKANKDKATLQVNVVGSALQLYKKKLKIWNL